ncbi:mitochondrial coenzyme A transporter [Phakopsora pachyrhizi]|uniref:Mitochondrial coenzyme A transporter n=1 Tax=Phakopsora pachyrhizi TaxID=170000 RepID=A0AAV0BFK6_PHAPC|nr:mitochondrial coenzyme A transporter [Phakopsora pachyrhizi]CAH7685957.1 mitochondrial coenzyme A transporter [Phakopsora pachyrhizi]
MVELPQPTIRTIHQVQTDAPSNIHHQHNHRFSRNDTDGDRTVTNQHTLLKSGIAGGIAGCLAKTIISPLDRVKILFQTRDPNYSKYSGSINGIFVTMRVIWLESGVRGLLQGHSATLLRIFPYAGIKFMAYDKFHQILMPEKVNESFGKRFLAGALSGMTSVFYTYPLELIRVRLAIQRVTKSETSIRSKTKSSPLSFITSSGNKNRVRIIDTIKSIYNESTIIKSSPIASNKISSSSTSWDSRLFERFPILKFYRGFLPTLLGMVPYAGTSFLVWGTLQSKIKKQEEKEGSQKNSTSKSLILNLISGSIAGLISQTTSYPFEIIRRKIQVGNSYDRSIVEIAKTIYRVEGLRGFFVGLSIGYIKIVPMTAISFVTWSSLKIRFE